MNPDRSAKERWAVIGLVGVGFIGALALIGRMNRRRGW